MSAQPAHHSHLAHLLDAASVPAPRALRLHIEQVSVVGMPLSPAHSRQFGAALAQELAQLARTPGWPMATASAALPGLIASPVSGARADAPAALGRDVARSLFEALRSSR